jgi:hypothetical protein
VNAAWQNKAVIMGGGDILNDFVDREFIAFLRMVHALYIAFLKGDKLDFGACFPDFLPGAGQFDLLEAVSRQKRNFLSFQFKRHRFALSLFKYFYSLGIAGPVTAWLPYARLRIFSQACIQQSPLHLSSRQAGSSVTVRYGTIVNAGSGEAEHQLIAKVDIVLVGQRSGRSAGSAADNGACQRTAAGKRAARCTQTRADSAAAKRAACLGTAACREQKTQGYSQNGSDKHFHSPLWLYSWS